MLLHTVTAILAGRSIVKIGVLITAGTNPMLLALAALAGTVVFCVFLEAANKCSVKSQPACFASVAMGGFVIYQILSGSIIESLIVAAIAGIANSLFTMNCVGGTKEDSEYIYLNIDPDD